MCGGGKEAPSLNSMKRVADSGVLIKEEEILGE